MKIAMIGDLHFRSTTPEARLDDYLATQAKLITWLRETFKGHLILCSGDVVHKPRERQDALGFTNYLLDNLPDMIGVLGNHDLLDHALCNIKKTTMGTLMRAGKYKVVKEADVENVFIWGFNYGEEIVAPTRKKNKGDIYIAVYHGMILEEPNPFFEGIGASEILAKFPQYDIILTGDNHKRFIVEDEARLLINPGSLKRDTADQIDHKPMVYVLDTETHLVDTVPVPIEDDIISREHLEKKKKRDARIEALSEKFAEVREVGIDYFENILQYMKENKVERAIKHWVMEWVA